VKVKLTKGRLALLADTEKLEREIGEALPNSFLEFIGQHDGAEPETNIFKIGGANESGVNGFIPVREIPDERANIENLPSTAFPVAWAEGGNYVFVDAACGTVYFWDHEQPIPPVQMASDFAAFVELLEPFDPGSIKLKPGQVKSAWIDPDFLKSLGR
jgi:hypothetical protein